MQLFYLTATLIIYMLNLKLCQSIENETIQKTNNNDASNESSNDTEKAKKIEDSPYYSEIKDLPNNELEAICTDRGFEIVKDNKSSSSSSNNNNNEYTRDDYMHAASQCLAIEAEMAKVIEEHPEILQELKEETNQMAYQKSLLEKELLDAQDQLTSLKKKEKGDDDGGSEDPTLFVTPKTATEENSSNNDDIIKDKEDREDEKVTPTPDDDDNNVNEEENKTNNEDPNSSSSIKVEKDVDGTDDIEVIDLDAKSDSIPHKEANISQQATDSPTTKNTDNIKKNDKSNTQEEDQRSSSKETIGITNINPSNHTLMDIINEVNAQILRDINLVLNTVLPEHIRAPLLQSLQPYFKVGKDSLNSVVDMFMRYASVVLTTVKDEVKNRQKKFMQEQQ